MVNFTGLMTVFMHCTLLIPDLLLNQAHGEAPYQGLRPRTIALETVLARADTSRHSPQTYDAWLCERYGIQRQHDWPIASLVAAASGIATENFYWLLADPVHLRIDRGRLLVAGGADIDIDADDFAALTVASDIRINNNQLAEAAPLLERVLAQQPANAVALNNLAWVYAEQQNPRAVELGRRAFALSPSAATSETLGWALTQSGDPKAALLLMSKAAAAMANDPTVQYHYAVTLRATGDKAEALAVAQKLIELVQPFPQQAAARQMVQELRDAR